MFQLKVFSSRWVLTFCFLWLSYMCSIGQELHLSDQKCGSSKLFNPLLKTPLSPKPPEAINSLYTYYNAIGLQASGHWVNSPFLGITATYHSLDLGEGGGRVFGGGLGVEGYVDDKILAPKAELWLHGFAFFLGGNLRLTAVYLNKDNDTNFILRPEVGLGLYRFYIYYGYNLFLEAPFQGIGRNTLTMSFLLDVIRIGDD
ncbi:MAG: hypothetical protein AAF193_02405 [Bacteroidota bacterium]